MYKTAGFSAQYGKFTEYKKVVLSKTDGAEKHKRFLAALKEWLRQHKEDPDRTKLKNKKSLMEVQKQLVTARTQRGEFQSPEMTFVLQEDWNEKKMVSMMRPRWWRRLCRGQLGKGFGR